MQAKGRTKLAEYYNLVNNCSAVKNKEPRQIQKICRGSAIRQIGIWLTKIILVIGYINNQFLTNWTAITLNLMW